MFRRIKLTAGIGVNRCQCESGLGALRASISFGKKLQSRGAPSYYLESLLCNAPTEAFSNKRVTRPKAHVRALVHSKRPFRKGL